MKKRNFRLRGWHQIEEPFLSRYIDAIKTFKDLVQDTIKVNKVDPHQISELKGIFNRLIKQDRPDFGRLWAYLNKPPRSSTKEWVGILYILGKKIRAKDWVGAEIELKKLNNEEFLDRLYGLLERLQYSFMYGEETMEDNDFNDDLAESFLEGKSKEFLQTRYERNPQARKICLSHHGYSCKICEFNFELFFGEIGKGFIHVHHINPIAEIGNEHKVDPKKDLIPVCPNCHAMIHSKRPAFTIEEIKEIRRVNYKNALSSLE